MFMIIDHDWYFKLICHRNRRCYLQVFDLESGRELTNQRVPKPMARTNTTIIDFFGTTRFMLGRSVGVN